MTQSLCELAERIEMTHHCKASYEKTFQVDEVFRSALAWDGAVESFTLTGHRQAQRCYAWTYERNGRVHYAIFLEILPVVGPGSAVNAAIAHARRHARPSAP